MTAVRYPKVSESALRRAWLDPDMTAAEAAASVGLPRCAFRQRAHHRGFPPRQIGRPYSVPVPEFTEMWNAGVGTFELARHFDVGKSTPFYVARRLGLTMYARGAKRITVSDYKQLKLAQAMTAEAAAARAALKERSA